MRPEIIDQFHDPGFRVLHELSGTFPNSVEHVKTAELNTDNGTDLPDRAFAWPEERRYPVHTRPHTALSLLYSTKCASVPEHVRKNLAHAQDIHGLVGLTLEKQASAEEDSLDDYLLPEMKRFRVKTSEDVLAAAVAVHRNYRKMDIPTRATACTRLLKKAQEFKIELPPMFQKMAGATICSAPVLLDALEMRKEAAKNKPYVREGYTKMAALVASIPPDEFSNPEILEKLAGGIARLDEMGNVQEHYDSTLPDPLLSVYNTEKVAQPMVRVAGVQVPLNRLMEVPRSAYEDVFGTDFANEVFKGGEAPDPDTLTTILPTMPLDLQNVFQKQLGR